MNIPIIDTHQHLIDPLLGPYSWTKGIPQLEGKCFDYDAYLCAIEGTGISRTVFMETTPDAWRNEAAHVFALSEQPSSIIGGVIANCHPEETDFEKYLDSIQSSKLVGLRRICHVEPDFFSQQPRFIENVRRLGPKGLTFDLCFLARQLSLAGELAQKCPEVQFVLDHCGVPDIAGGALDPWRESLRELAKLPNVACKISGILAYCKPGNATSEAVRPYIEHSIECFGWDRVMWGGDWPVITQRSSLKKWVEISREIVGAACESDQHKLFHENAVRIYGIK
ncbi:MAG: amidohydrolase [Verrucomicrobia bacterium]|nr:amidohydrolase [Verrucomicrobiota bacterium]